MSPVTTTSSPTVRLMGKRPQSISGWTPSMITREGGLLPFDPACECPSGSLIALALPRPSWAPTDAHRRSPDASPIPHEVPLRRAAGDCDLDSDDSQRVRER